MTLLDEILAPSAITTLFQPIVSFGRDGTTALHGYEALTRGPSGTHASRADILFDYVRRKRAEPTVDRACIVSALRAAASLPACPHLSLNVHAATLGQDEHIVDLLIDTAVAAGLRPEQLVIEIVEQSSRWNSVGFTRAIAALRRAGVAVALDDFGTGFSNFQLLVDVRPDFVKVDRYFIAGSAEDPTRRAMLGAIQDLARNTGCAVVAEGVETSAELTAVRAAGISLVQGYLLSPPRAAAQPYFVTDARPVAASLSA